MRNRIFLSAIPFLVAALPSLAQPPSPIIGQWQADKSGSPWVLVNVTRASDHRFGGTIVFFVVDREASPSRAKPMGRQEIQLLDPNLTGDVFSFSVKNQQGPVTLDPSSSETLRFQMILRDPTHAELRPMNRKTADILLVKKE